MIKDTNAVIKEIEAKEKEMYEAAQNLEFEKAAQLRDDIKTLREQLKRAV